MNTSGCFVVSYCFEGNKDDYVLLVGEKEKKLDVKVINAFQGEKAIDIYKMLTTKEETNNG